MGVSRGELLAVLGTAFLLSAGSGGSGVPVAHAAPVPKEDLEAKAKKLDELWNDLMANDNEKISLAMFRLGRTNDLLPFLKAKLKPVKFTEAECKQWLKKLGDKDEKVWKRAYDWLHDNNPLLVLDFPDIWDAIPEEGPGRKRYAILNFAGDSADSVGTWEGKFADDVELRANARMGGSGYTAQMKKAPDAPADTADGGWSLRTDRNRLWSRSWQRSKLAIRMIEDIATSEAVKALQAMATGHEDASPTKAAKEALERLKAK